MQQRGFTLIELIIVIVILGILAVTAAPRFVDLNTDARAATINGVQAAMQAGGQLIYAKSAIQGEQDNDNAGDGATSRDDDVDSVGVRVETENGYPDADSQDQAMLEAWLDLDFTNDWQIATPAGAASATNPGPGSIGIHPIGVTPNYTLTAVNGQSCHVLYTNSQGDNQAPVVSVVTGGC